MIQKREANDHIMSTRDKSGQHIRLRFLRGRRDRSAGRMPLEVDLHDAAVIERLSVLSVSY